MVRSSVPIISGSPDCFDATAPEESLQRNVLRKIYVVRIADRTAWLCMGDSSWSVPFTPAYRLP